MSSHCMEQVFQIQERLSVNCYHGFLYDVVIGCVSITRKLCFLSDELVVELKLESGKELCILTPILALGRSVLPQLIEEVSVLRIVAIQF